MNDLENRAHSEGEAWADRCIDELTTQGRAICGGWPGTKSEASRLTAKHVCRTQPTVDRDKFQDLSTALYLSAKKRWLAQTTPNRKSE